MKNCRETFSKPPANRVQCIHSDSIDTKIWTCRNERNFITKFVIFSEIVLDK